ncbi:MAG: ribosome maturation factor RimM, partial [Alcanivorax nanhaiticus]
MTTGGQQSSELEVVGRILGVHGVQGWVKVFSDTDPRENIQHYQPWHLKQGGPKSGGEWKPVKVTGFRPQGKGLIAQLEGITDRNMAAALVGHSLLAGGARWGSRAAEASRSAPRPRGTRAGRAASPVGG